MAQIKNLEKLSADEINRELENGAKFVEFRYCISLILVTLRRGSDIYFIKAGESTARHSIGFTLLTLLFGWWGIPWGPIYTISSMFTNITGGKDVTQHVLESLNSYAGESE